jgi:hypothetical protein
MKYLYAAVLFTLITATSLNAGTIYVNSNRLSAIKVFVTNSRISADLLVYKTGNRLQASGKDGIWYFVSSRVSADASVYFVKSSIEADVKIFFVSSPIEAGWRQSNSFQGSFH